MVSPERIQALADRIGSLFHPDRVILFGSYAYGTPTEDADVDILVVMPARERDRARLIGKSGTIWGIGSSATW